MKSKLFAVGKILLSTFGVLILFISIVGTGNYFQSQDLGYVGNIFMFLFPFAVYFYVYFLNKKLLNLKPPEYGFTLRRFFPNFAVGFAVSTSIMIVVLAISVLTLDVKVEFVPLKDNFFKPFVSLVSMVIIVGVWEEFYFRGFVFNCLMQSKFGFHLSAFISAILFSVIHWSSFDMNETSWLWYIGIVFIGYLFVIIYTLTKSIWSVVSFHIFWNLYALLMDGKENEIGIFSVFNYTKISKSLDNVTVCVLGIVLAVLLILKQNTLKDSSKNNLQFEV